MLEGNGGIKPLTEKDKASIRQTIEADVLKRCTIEFRSTQVDHADPNTLNVRGDLKLFGNTAPVSFEVRTQADGRLTGSATVKQTEWGIKPYTALFGALKVADEVIVEIDGNLPSG